jgi:nicotinamidase-related amidase
MESLAKDVTGLLVIDPYNDFISEGGKLWPYVKKIAEEVNCVRNMERVLEVARQAQLRVFFAPHHRYREGDFATWKTIAPIQKAAWHRKTFEEGSWGGEFHPAFKPLPGEIVAQEHWCSSGFAGTDLDYQLKRHSVHRLITIGLKANTCVESTIRHAVELGYEVILVKDATAAFNSDEMRAAIEVNLPAYATAILTADEAIAQLSALTEP